MNPWTIVAGLALAVALWFGGDYAGHKSGVNEQKVADQAAIDKVTNDLTAQKAEANRLAREELAQVTALLATREQTLKTLEDQHEKDQTTTNAMRGQLATERLRFAADAGRGSGGSVPGHSPSGAASSTEATTCVLSAAADRDLKQIAFDADTLRDDYRLLYDWAQGVSCGH